jgi:hypothetical protein
MNAFILLLIGWMIWKHQNVVVFNGPLTLNHAGRLLVYSLVVIGVWLYASGSLCNEC